MREAYQPKIGQRILTTRLRVNLNPNFREARLLQQQQHIYLSIHPSFCLTIHLPIYSSRNLSVYRSIHPSISLIYSSIHSWSIYPRYSIRRGLRRRLWPLVKAKKILVIRKSVQNKIIFSLVAKLLHRSKCLSVLPLVLSRGETWFFRHINGLYFLIPIAMRYIPRRYDMTIILYIL